MGRTIGYLRVSTIEQDLNKNKAKLLALANDKKLDKHKEKFVALLKNGLTKTFIAKRYCTSVSNLHGWLKRHDINEN